ncbi:Bud-site selection protein, BUD22 [Cordyceps fumosorosea ARSEF 2679]|uniref:Bud-site selection protein, BUD22 n=1 Tax=Cordyceps fumosorosea (strain ARSEF 2679) TaxID=1081104 RepID=A0A168BU39_CORFA|nr:Bud-site selection protein, BUD22 [Cordyceps fumosorosea ARSEF 2679]OAA70553.1 Bud-site selection protein, BUD22 [Cordyceps fumosorosea ARSEF 2679]
MAKMAKRKREDEPLSMRQLQKFQDELARALKAAKGHERQRMAKKQRTIGGDPEQKQKLEREINVLKSLDLHQTARAHLYTSLLRIKRVANHQDLPELIKRGVAKPDLPEDERAVLHKVTSGLYNHGGVKKVVDEAVASVCGALGIPAPEKGGKGKRKDAEEPTPPADLDRSRAGADDDDGEETDFEGFSADSDDDENTQAVEDLDSEEEVARENDFDAMDGLLGSSSDSDEDEDEERARLWEKYRGKEAVNLDDISVSGGDSDLEDAEDDGDDSSDDDGEPPAKTTTRGRKLTSRGISLSPSPSPPPPRKRSKKADRAAARPTNSTFLPSLMGGYVSGSESASDVDVAPPKKRRGQMARRAIWEQKYGSKAKHIQDGAGGKGRGKGRDDGWDMKRGAVDGADGGRTPWKKGVKNPFSSGGGGDNDGGRESRRPQQPPTKRDDEGTLHPSWEARKKAKESQKAVAFAGSKVVFD